MFKCWAIADRCDEPLKIICRCRCLGVAELSFGETAIYQNCVVDGHSGKKLAARQVEGQAFCYMSPVGQPSLIEASNVGQEVCG
mgnify:CR=1 FL=1